MSEGNSNCEQNSAHLDKLYQASKESHFKRRIREYNQRKLKIPFNDMVFNQTYKGYIDYYQESVDIFVTQHLSGVRPYIDTIELVFQMEFECRVAKIMDEYCT